ncbi:MAG: 3-oxoacyl-ACP reductase FabG [Bacteroidales bacterium]|nr:3-oxoacyl-ACP reductase FabG [Bacteroidales bacterium]MBQ3677658.1 3-oxoacyl-ACP reductase FabG [Bacteroidales bacterium]MBQ4216194.1 3-oxoacyl-ACP reductase FabG [Bacteroidales bacterium]MBR4689890.1 3-oxoacyl-ACP reductase FabG [Bacteroidales bacterium]MBR7034197.1 3-oxoacyl-ACP reductase FabG [Bacteroidales bacterium]
MKYALITGGSRGIGRAVCYALAKEGFSVIINYRSNEAAAMEVKQEIEKNGGSAELLPFDVSDSKSVDVAIQQWQSSHPEEYISVLVNNAGIRDDAVMVFMQDEQWNKVLRTNLDSFFYVTRRLLKSMITKRYGRIVNVASLSGIKGLAGQTNYSAAKAGLIGSTKALAQEIGSRKITVNAVAPGFIATDMTQDLPEAELKKMIPAGRFGTPEEVADLVAFLASDKAAYINGEVISINGGLYT